MKGYGHVSRGSSAAAGPPPAGPKSSTFSQAERIGWGKAPRTFSIWPAGMWLLNVAKTALTASFGFTGRVSVSHSATSAWNC
jgi:hypothetical protein